MRTSRTGADPFQAPADFRSLPAKVVTQAWDEIVCGRCGRFTYVCNFQEG